MNKNGLNQIIVVVLLIFLAFIAILAVLVSIKTLTKSVETRSENLQTELEIPLKTGGCVPNLLCGEWGACEYVYGAGNVFAQSVFLTGEHSQSCSDLNSCASNYNQTQNCISEKKVNISQVEKCSKKYIEIRNSVTGELVSRLKLQPGRLDIDLILGDVAYCDFCYNGILDEGSEDYIDCDIEGEVCSKSNCPAEMHALTFDYNLIIVLVLSVILASIFYYLFLKKKQMKRGEQKLRKKRLKGKKAKAKKRKTRKK